MTNTQKLKAVVEVAVEDMAVMFMNPNKPKAKPWRMVPADELVRRILPLCEFVRGLESGIEGNELAKRAHDALEFFLVDPIYGDNEGIGK